MEHWLNVHRVFAIEAFLKNNDSTTVTQRVFRCHFDIGRNGEVGSNKKNHFVVGK